MQAVLFYPLDRRYPRVRLRTRQASALAGQRIVVVVDAWEANSRSVHLRAFSVLRLGLPYR
jgi:exosome complex exonuclease DIS3/RRP44